MGHRPLGISSGAGMSTHPQPDCRLTSSAEDIAIIIARPLGNTIWSASLVHFLEKYLTVCNGDTPAEAALAAIEAAQQDLPNNIRTRSAHEWMRIAKPTIEAWVDGVPPDGACETAA